MATIAACWRALHIDLSLAREYQLYFMVAGTHATQPPPNPILERLLPGLLHLKATAILDEALQRHLDARGERVWPPSLKERMDAAGRCGLLRDVRPLHDVRDRRNDVAHEFSECISWNELERDLASIHEALAELGDVTGRPTFTVVGERLPRKQLQNPHAALGFDYRIDVLDGSTRVAQLAWGGELMPDDAA